MKYLIALISVVVLAAANEQQTTDRVTVNNDNEHHKRLYVQDHQRHQQPSTTSRVLELSDRFLEIVNNPVLQSHGNVGPSSPKYAPWLVKFYAPWCGHCKRLEPVFNHVAQALHNTAVRVGKIDCTRFPSVGAEFKIHGYPTIMFIAGPRKHVFQGDRTVDEIVKFAKRMNSPATRTIEDLHDFVNNLPHEDAYPPPTKDSSAPATTKISEHPDLFFGLLRPSALINDLVNSFRLVALHYQQHNDFYEFNTPAPSTPIVFAYKHGRIVAFADATSTNLTDSLRQWVGNERHPDVISLTRTNLYNLFTSSNSNVYNKRPLVVAGVVNQDKLNRIVNDPEMKLVNTIINVAKRAVQSTLQEPIKIPDISIPITNLHVPVHYAVINSPELANSLVAEQLVLPCLLIIDFDPEGNHKYYVFNEGLDTESSIENLVELTREGHFTPYVYANSWRFKIYRYGFDAFVGITDMWVGNPVLTIVLFGLPLGFLSLILYSICCGDILDAKESEEEEELLDSEDEAHEKRE